PCAEIFAAVVSIFFAGSGAASRIGGRGGTIASCAGAKDGAGLFGAAASKGAAENDSRAGGAVSFGVGTGAYEPTAAALAISRRAGDAAGAADAALRDGVPLDEPPRNSASNSSSGAKRPALINRNNPISRCTRGSGLRRKSSSVCKRI